MDTADILPPYDAILAAAAEAPARPDFRRVVIRARPAGLEVSLLKDEFGPTRTQSPPVEAALAAWARPLASLFDKMRFSSAEFVLAEVWEGAYRPPNARGFAGSPQGQTVPAAIVEAVRALERAAIALLLRDPGFDPRNDSHLVNFPLVGAAIGRHSGGCAVAPHDGLDPKGIVFLNPDAALAGARATVAPWFLGLRGASLQGWLAPISAHHLAALHRSERERETP